MSSSNDAFKLKQDSITSTTGWNGAEYKHSFGKSAQDFVSTCKIHVNQKNKGSTHFAQYLYDTDNRLIEVSATEMLDQAKRLVVL